MIEPPLMESVDGAIDRLRGVGALDNRTELTPLGFHLASLPVDVRIGETSHETFELIETSRPTIIQAS